MSTANPPQPEYEFNVHQQETIGGLAYRMSGVGFVLMLLGVLQIAFGIAAYMSGKLPEQLGKAAEAAKVPAPVEPLVIALAIGLVGALYLLIGMWTRQASKGFYGIVHSRGQDVTRLMDAIGALRKTYGLIYNLMLLSAVFWVVSVILSLKVAWKG